MPRRYFVKSKATRRSEGSDGFLGTRKAGLSLWVTKFVRRQLCCLAVERWFIDFWSGDSFTCLRSTEGPALAGIAQ